MQVLAEEKIYQSAQFPLSPQSPRKLSRFLDTLARSGSHGDRTRRASAVRKLAIWCQLTGAGDKTLLIRVLRSMINLVDLDPGDISGQLSNILEDCPFSLLRFATSIPLHNHLATFLCSQDQIRELDLRDSPSLEYAAVPLSLPNLEPIRARMEFLETFVPGSAVQIAHVYGALNANSSLFLSALSQSKGPILRLEAGCDHFGAELLDAFALHIPHLEVLSL